MAKTPYRADRPCGCAGARAGSNGPPTQEEISGSPDAPLLVRPMAGLPYQVCANLADGLVPLNTGRYDVF